jgi:hypothetical protein
MPSILYAIIHKVISRGIKKGSAAVFVVVTAEKTVAVTVAITTKQNRRCSRRDHALHEEASSMPETRELTGNRGFLAHPDSGARSLRIEEGGINSIAASR